MDFLNVFLCFNKIVRKFMLKNKKLPVICWKQITGSFTALFRYFFLHWCLRLLFIGTDNLNITVNAHAGSGRNQLT